MSDPLGVLASTGPVVAAAGSVRVERAALGALADRLAATPFVRPVWRVQPHWWSDDPAAAAQYVFVLDALNFCFWAPAGARKWQVDYGGRTWDGYWALAACLRRAIEAGRPLLEAEYLADLDEPRTAELLAGAGELPLPAARVAGLRRLGLLLRDRYAGRAANLVAAAGGSAVALVQRVAAELPSFDDVATYRGRPVRFYKRAQILCSDLFGACDGAGPGRFEDLDALTAFADYKLPQVLRELGALAYAGPLAERIERLEELPAGGAEEVEIRAATVWAVEWLRRELAARGLPLKAFELDWHLWTLGQRAGWRHPYHRVRTEFY